MTITRTAVVLAAAFLCGAHQLAAHSQAAAQHPSFSGTWTPSDPERSNKLFSVGLTAIPGDGSLKIDQTTDLFTVTITVPEDKLKIRLALTDGPFTPTMVYLTGSLGRSGGVGAGGPPALSRPTWVGDQLVIPNARPGTSMIKGITATYSLDGDHLRLETHSELVDGRANNVTELFAKAKSN